MTSPILVGLADPEDFGNKPGEGPLRVGGTPGEPPQAKDNLPSTMSPARQAQEPALTMVRDLEGGAERVRMQSTTYLPRNPGEDMQNYNTRLARSVFFNAFGETTQALTGLVFSQDPVLSEDVPPAIVEQWENIDMAGTHGDVFAADVFHDAFTSGHAAILVDFPNTGGAKLSKAEESALGIRPYWLPIKKDNILSWRTEIQAGQTILVQVVLLENTFVPKGAYGEVLQTRYRVLYRNEGIVGWRLFEIDDNKVLVMVNEGLYANQTEIPLAEVITSGQRSMFVSQPPLLDLAYLNVAHYQQDSDYVTSRHMTCVPIFCLFGVEDTDTEGGPVVVGPNSGVFSTNENAKAFYASHDGAALEEVRMALQNILSAMGTLGIAMLSPQKRQAETAEAKRMDKSASDSKLGKAARGLQDGIERALQFHANYLKLPSGGSIEINRDFEGLMLDASVMTAYARLTEAGFPPRITLRALQDGGRIADDIDLDELELEIMAALEAKAEAAEQMSQATGGNAEK